MASLYELKDLSKRYTRGKETITIFEELTMSIPQGDFIAIMGPSGSGKTTLLNLIARLYDPVEGEVLAILQADRRRVSVSAAVEKRLPSLNQRRKEECPLLST